MNDYLAFIIISLNWDAVRRIALLWLDKQVHKPHKFTPKIIRLKSVKVALKVKLILCDYSVFKGICDDLFTIFDVEEKIKNRKWKNLFNKRNSC